MAIRNCPAKNKVFLLSCLQLQAKCHEHDEILLKFSVTTNKTPPPYISRTMRSYRVLSVRCTVLKPGVLFGIGSFRVRSEFIPTEAIVTCITMPSAALYALHCSERFIWSHFPQVSHALIYLVSNKGSRGARVRRYV